MVQIDVSGAIKSIENSFGRLTPKQMQIGISRALNHTTAKAKTAAARKIREVYKIRARDIKRAMVQVRARWNHLTARIDITGAPLPLMAFGARQVKRGVSVNVMGQRKIVNRAFISTMPGGHKGVFARGTGKGKFQFRKKREVKSGPDLPISELFTVSVPQTISNEAVMGAIARGIEAGFADRLGHELSRMLAGLPPIPDGADLGFEI